MQTVVVTGASTGIGRGITYVMLKSGWRVFGSVRKSADAQALKAEFGEAFDPLLFDFEDNEAIIAASAEVKARLAGRTLDGLVNNAISTEQCSRRQCYSCILTVTTP
jgi:NAD(P)-dependent dehydrogenase (short-subunit alcohol dehydrogenase family)